MGNAKEELALPLHGKKSRFKRSDFVDYFGIERLGLSQKVVEQEVLNITQLLPKWEKLINESFLSNSSKSSYLTLIHSRLSRLVK